MCTVTSDDEAMSDRSVHILKMAQNSHFVFVFLFVFVAVVFLH